LKKKGFRIFLKRATDFSDTFSKEYSWRTEIQREREIERVRDRKREIERVRDRKREGEIERVRERE
jgi:hypothetical protein